MKSAIRTIVTLALMFAFAACGNKKSGAQFNDRTARQQTGTYQAQVGKQIIDTLVYANDPSTWMDSVKQLVSPTIGADYVTPVAPDGSNNTGVFMGARLCLPGGVSASQNFSPRGLVAVQVIDAYGPIPIYLNAVAGGYDATTQTVNVTFQDSYGAINLYGQVYGSNFQGYFSFNNLGGEGWQTMGTFYMATSSLFSCY